LFSLEANRSVPGRRLAVRFKNGGIGEDLHLRYSRKQRELSRWIELMVKRKKTKGPGAFVLPAPFQQRTNTSWRSFDPNPRFHGGCFGVLRHTSSEALKL